MTDAELTKARLYAIDKMRYNEVHSIFNEVETTVKTFDLIFPSLDFMIDITIDWCSAVVMEKIGKYLSEL